MRAVTMQAIGMVVIAWAVLLYRYLEIMKTLN